MYYPSVYLEWDKDYEFPAEGTMTVKFVRTGRSENESRDGKVRYTVNLDLTELSDVKPSKDAKESKDESTSEALDRLKEDYESD